MNDNDSMEGWQTADPDPGPTPVVTHVITDHHCADVLAEVVLLNLHRWLGFRMMCIVTSEPVGNERRCQLQSMNYVALTTRVNCSRLLNHNFCMHTVVSELQEIFMVTRAEKTVNGGSKIINKKYCIVKLCGKNTKKYSKLNVKTRVHN